MPRGAIAKKPEPIQTGRIASTAPEQTYTAFRDAFPRSEGPPSVSEGQYKDAYSGKNPTIMVAMDGGAYRALWELVEAEANHKWESRNSLMSTAAYIRAVQALREGWRRHVEAGTSPQAIGGAG